MRKPELLAPAGDLERLKIALLYGADAVYIGGSLFSLRANAINFTEEQIDEAVKFAHSLNKKVYVTANISLHNKEVKLLTDYLKRLDDLNVDAIIASDPAVIQIAKENTNLEIHLSTQQSTLNYEAVKFWKSEGVTRIVLARETSKEEIKEIMDNCDIEIETFIHGAMCTSYSGRCVLSNFFTGRDSNRGGCSQICRWNFTLLNEKHEVLEGTKDFTLSTKDLSQLRYIPDMIDLGITSFKIEGRMRSIYYIATVVSTYRKTMDAYINNHDDQYKEENERILSNVANRDSISQFYDGNYSKDTQYYNGRTEVSNQEFLGLVLDYKDGYVTLEQRNYFEKNDLIEFFGPNTKPFKMTIEEIIDEDDNLIDIVRHPKQVVKIKVNQKLEKFDMARAIKIS
jgi:U32 family peptidase